MISVNFGIYWDDVMAYYGQRQKEYSAMRETQDNLDIID